MSSTSCKELQYPDNLEGIIDKEFSRLQGLTYLDHTGATLYAKSQIDAYTHDLQSNIYGNPHSGNPSSELMLDTVHQVRNTVLAHFNVSCEEYDVVFTHGATEAIKILADNFNWTPASKFVYLEDNHTSVVGVREIVAQNDCEAICMFLNSGKSAFDLKNYSPVKVKNISKLGDSNGSNRTGNIFAYPAQSNFSGCKYPLSWIHDVKNNDLDLNMSFLDSNENWYVLLDAAAFVPCSKLDLRENPADFVCLSFYKIFGFPTGLGCLLVRKSAEDMLLKKGYFGGGTAAGYLATSDYFKPRINLHQRLEDGSIPFLEIMALQHGFNILNKIDRSMKAVQAHTFSLIKRLYNELVALQHLNAAPVVKVYSHTDYSESNLQGGILTFNIQRADGSFIGFNHVLQLAASQNIHLRSGCFCNTGACVRLLNLDPENVKHIFQGGRTCGDHIDVIDNQPIGAIRASVGYMSTMADINSLLQFIKESFVQETITSVISNGDIFYDASSAINTSHCSLSLEKIFVYPIKSCRAIEVKQWELCSTGLVYDRMWMIVTDFGVCLTLKRENMLALIQPTLDLKAQTLTLEADGHSSVTVPLDLINNEQNMLEVNACQSKVCGDRVLGYDCGPEVMTWLTDFLGYKSHLIKKNNEPRFSKVNKAIHDENGLSNLQSITLTNEAQYLLLTRESVEHLQRQMKKSQEQFNSDSLAFDEIVSRFRCNLLVAGCKPFEEESWTGFVLKNKLEMVNFKFCGLSSRCSMVCVNHKTGEKGLEPLRTLGTLPPPNYGNKQQKRRNHFGIYLYCECTESAIAVGDEVFLHN
ncbi:molybdenum cofactor sulfurase-like [Ciona intestinalis]